MLSNNYLIMVGEKLANSSIHALDQVPTGYDSTDVDIDSDGEWTFNTTTNKITHIKR